MSLQHSKRQVCFAIVGFIFLFCANGILEDAEIDPFDDFMMACTEGNLQVLEIMIEEHPDFITKRTKQGESCLHGAGIKGQTGVTKTILRHGGNPDQRSTFSQGLRMTPLSWNVYGGHIETAKILLEAGANVNLDFDQASDSGTEELATVLDILYSSMQGQTKSSKDPWHLKNLAMEQLLLQYGAKRYKDLIQKGEEL